MLKSLDQAIRDWKFRATLAPRIDVAVEDWHRAQPPPVPEPIIIEHPINDELQTGDSRLLGGAMEIKSPWRRND